MTEAELREVVRELAEVYSTRDRAGDRLFLHYTPNVTPRAGDLWLKVWDWLERGLDK